LPLFEIHFTTFPFFGSTQPNIVCRSLFVCCCSIAGCLPFSPHLYDTVAVLDIPASSSNTTTESVSISNSFF